MRPSGPARFDGAMNMQSPAAVRRLMELSNGRSVADDGQDLLEYALLTGIFATATIALFPPIATAMGAAYERWQSGAEAVWEACPPGGCS